jgi:hypothetical protein
MTVKPFVPLFFAMSAAAFAQDPAATTPADIMTEHSPAVEATANPEPAPAAKFVVFLPEQVDAEWFWYYYSDTSQHIVQSAVEKALINAGFDVIDIGSVKNLQVGWSIQKIASTDGAKEAAREAGATYAVVGSATAVKASEGAAYGVNVFRSNAEITAKIIRVSDGKILAMEDAGAQKGGQAQQSAGQEALKDAGGAIARKIAAAAKRVTGDQ